MGYYQLPKIIGKDNKPPFGARINWHHPLSQGLVGAWLFNEGAGSKCFDVINNMVGTIASGTYWDSEGIYIPSSPSTVPVTVPHQSIQDPPIISIFAITTNHTSTSSLYPTVISKSPSGINYAFGISGNMYLRFWNKSFDNTLTYWTELNINQSYKIGCTGDGSGLRIYLDGNLVGSNIVAYDTPGGVASLNFGENFGYYTNQTTKVIYLYNRSLTNGEHASLAANPYQMILHPIWDTYYIPTAAPPPTGGKSIFGYDSIFHAGGIIQT